MATQDSQLLNRVYENANKLPTNSTYEHPLDKSALGYIKEIIDKIEVGDDYKIYECLDKIKQFWKVLIEKSIICLRYNDKREPFLINSKTHPVVYGINELNEYFKKYVEFESLLYGGGKYYRDHVIHVFRVWVLGIDVLLADDLHYLNKIEVGENVKVNEFEKLSIWTIIALTHDLGYPLEIAQDIVEKTRSMMTTFISNPVVSMDLSFNGIQNNINDIVVRFLSSKMKNVTENDYVARLQHKYYFKFQKSLESSHHGIISAIIIYKLLLYFLESDYSINEDYCFKEEDVRQFYIRREILRAIASHTCRDIYHLNMLNFAFLLIITDDCQEWGRKRISELYVRGAISYALQEIKTRFNSREKAIPNDIGINKDKIDVHECITRESFEIDTDEEAVVPRLLFSFWKQRDYYLQVFRDGQDTVLRNFTYSKKSEITWKKRNGNVNFTVEFSILDEGSSVFHISTYKDSSYKRNFVLQNFPNTIKDKFKESNSDDLIKYEYNESL